MENEFEKIPTAKEVFDRMLEMNDECTSVEMMIEFARIHVEAQKKAIKENAKVELDKNWIRKKEKIHPRQLIDTIEVKVNEISIDEAYSIERIK